MQRHEAIAFANIPDSELLCKLLYFAVKTV